MIISGMFFVSRRPDQQIPLLQLIAVIGIAVSQLRNVIEGPEAPARFEQAAS